ncbi:alcohol dehydrogenase [Glaciecola punicea]|uniref:NADPH-dependent aldehyde reductase Ahr n=1 Tax=Glaciecola punicea TaxID=56804 RepID=UPI000871F8AF|nr:NAD(P)-dependent alcohol dehydrogenase [Glaciecola punicea]OFA31623.1 alcohol dehydrogenase [Glaciecola punicea]
MYAYAVQKAGQALSKIELELPPLGADEVKIKVSYCGICHSDLSMLNNEWGASTFPLVAGHEVSGEVVEVGSSVSKHKVGDVVGLGWHAAYCDTCRTCDTGDQNLCASAQPTIIGRHGGFAEFVQASQTSVVALPKGIDVKSAGPMFCGGITVFNPLVQFDIKPTSKVAVIGIGGLGHLALQFLNAWGCEVTAFTSSESKFDEAKSMGAHHVINSIDAKQIEAANSRFDLIISTVNVKLDWNLYLTTLTPKGRLHFVGATLEPLNVGVFSLIGGQKSISGSPVGSPDTIKTMLDFANQHSIEPLVEEFPMSQVNEAIAHLESGKARYRIVLKADF